MNPAVPEPLPSILAVPGRLLFKVRGWLFVPFALFALLWTRWEWEQDRYIWPLGLGLILAGSALRYRSILRMGGAARTHKDKAKRLVDSGPYARVRNPLYIANLTAFAGFVILCELPWLAVIAMVVLGSAYHAIARYEETVLQERFGRDFEDYRSRVPMWIPRRPDAHAAEDASGFYPLGKLIRRERGSILNALFLVALAMSKELIAHS